jgi:hypothetical protein
MERFQTRPMGRVFCAIHDFKITSFVADSSRSYANLFKLNVFWSLNYSVMARLSRCVPHDNSRFGLPPAAKV